MADSFVSHVFQTTRRGIGAIGYPILLKIVEGVARLGGMGAIFFLVYMYARGGVSSEIALLYGCLMGIFWGGWWIFSASCRLMWWRTLAQSSDRCERKGRWIQDLSAVMGLDLAFGGIRFLGIVAVICGTLGMVFNQSLLGVLVVVLAGMVFLVCSFMHPVILAMRIVGGPGLFRAICDAIHQIMRYPASALAVRFMPGILSLTLYGISGCEAMIGNWLVSGGAILAAVLVSLIRPVFWTEFALYPGKTENEVQPS